MDFEFSVTKAKEKLAKEIYEKYIKDQVDLFYKCLLESKENFGFSGQQNIILLNLESCSALIYISQENSSFCGEINIEYTVIHKILTSTDVRYACLITQTVCIKQETEINGRDSVNMEINEPIISQSDFENYLNYENYIYFSDENIYYPLTFKAVGMNTPKKINKEPSKNICSLVSEILNQFAVVRIF